MKQITFNDVIDSSKPSKLCLSVYLPYDNNSNIQSFKSIKKQIKSLLNNLPEAEALSVIEKFNKDIQAITELQRQHGIAWFYSDLTHGYIPINWRNDPFVVIADSFHIKPILRDRQIHKPFFILLVGAKSIRLFSNFSGFLILIEEIDPQISGSAIDSQNQKKIINYSEKLLARHCSTSNDPLILAGPRVLISRIDEELGYHFKISPPIACSPDVITLEDLCSKSHKISLDHYTRLEEEIVSNYQYCKKSNSAISDIQKISVAAISGQIENLIVAENYHVWGIINKKSGAIQVHKEQTNFTDDDLLDDISEIVHHFKGNVWVIPKEKLQGSPIYATLRW